MERRRMWGRYQKREQLLDPLADPLVDVRSLSILDLTMVLSKLEGRTSLYYVRISLAFDWTA
jgi:hypothetical protein